jgi:predicted RNase H-like nuclease (RuvC/YqgF family)
MTEEELRILVGSLAVSTASNTEANRELRAMVESQGESIRELRATVESQGESIRELRATVESQERVMTEGFASLTATAESQARSIESMRESVSYNTEMVTSALTLVSEALKLSANTSKNLDRLEIDIADLKQIVGIVISESQADRVRFSRLEGQD